MYVCAWELVVLIHYDVIKILYKYLNLQVINMAPKRKKITKHSSYFGILYNLGKGSCMGLQKMLQVINLVQFEVASVYYCVLHYDSHIQS